MSAYVVPDVTVANAAKFAQPDPWHFSTKYPVTATLSVDAVHARLIRVAEAAVAVKLPGTVGAVVSAAAGVTPFAMFEKPLMLLAASLARTR